MRTLRLLGIALAAAAIAANLSACQGASNSTSSTETTTVAPTTITTTAEIGTMPTGQWTAAGDLCKIITGDMVSEMFNERELVGAFNVSPDYQGIDYCSYAFLGANNTRHGVVRVGAAEYSTEKWRNARNEATTDASEVIEFTINSVDEAFYANHEAWVRKGNVAVAAQPLMAGTFDKTQLVKLAAIAATLVS